MDAMQGAFGDADGLPSDLVIILAVIAAAACLPALLAALRDILASPSVRPAIGGSVAFW